MNEKEVHMTEKLQKLSLLKKYSKKIENVTCHVFDIWYTSHLNKYDRLNIKKRYL